MRKTHRLSQIILKTSHDIFIFTLRIGGFIKEISVLDSQGELGEPRLDKADQVRIGLKPSDERMLGTFRISGKLIGSAINDNE